MTDDFLVEPTTSPGDRDPIDDDFVEDRVRSLTRSETARINRARSSAARAQGVAYRGAIGRSPAMRPILALATVAARQGVG